MRADIERALKEVMQKDKEKQKVKSHIFLKVELLEATFFTPQNGRNAIDQLQFGKAEDHDGLVGAQFNYIHHTLIPLAAHILNTTIL